MISPAPLTDRVLARLYEAELQLQEGNPWLSDDIRIAWITVSLAAEGHPAPHVESTFRVIGLHPDKVWAAIVERRKTKLGTFYSRFYDENDLWRSCDVADLVTPKKPAQSVTLDDTRSQTKAAAA